MDEKKETQWTLNVLEISHIEFNVSYKEVVKGTGEGTGRFRGNIFPSQISYKDLPVPLQIMLKDFVITVLHSYGIVTNENDIPGRKIS